MQARVPRTARPRFGGVVAQQHHRNSAGYLLGRAIIDSFPDPVDQDQKPPEKRGNLTHAAKTYESLARKGETMTTAAMARYAYDQIDQARTELTGVSK